MVLRKEVECAGQLRVHRRGLGPPTLSVADSEGGMFASEGDVAGLQDEGLGDAEPGPPLDQHEDSGHNGGHAGQQGLHLWLGHVHRESPGTCNKIGDNVALMTATPTTSIVRRGRGLHPPKASVATKLRGQRFHPAGVPGGAPGLGRIGGSP